MNQGEFDQIIERTRIVREYGSILPLQRSISLPYIILTQHPNYEAKISALRGNITMEPPLIYIPGNEINFGEGFNDIGEVTVRLNYQRLAFPSYRVNHKGVPDSALHVGKIDDIVNMEKRKLDELRDEITGIIIGVPGHPSVAVLKYVSELMVKSANSNIEEAITIFRSRN